MSIISRIKNLFFKGEVKEPECIPETEGEYYSDSQIVDYLTNCGWSAMTEMYAIPYDDIIRGHHSFGRYIRNYFKMWETGNPYSDFDDVNGDNFPDQRSHRILQQCWEIKNKG